MGSLPDDKPGLRSESEVAVSGRTLIEHVVRSVGAVSLAVVLVGALTASANPKPIVVARTERAGAAEPQGATVAAADAPCSIRGYPTIAPNSRIYGARDGGQPIARFTGRPTALVAYDFPQDGEGRVPIRTGTGKGSFRIGGFVPVNDLPISTQRDVPVIADHVWIARGQRVAVIGREGGGALRIEHDAKPPIEHTFRAVARCDALGFTSNDQNGTIPYVVEAARAFVATGPDTAVYATPRTGERPVVTLTNEAPGILFWGRENVRGFVQVEHASDVIVKGWVRSADLRPLPEGEIIDQPSKPIDETERKLAPAGDYEAVTVDKEIPLRTAPRQSARVIGRVEAETDAWVVRRFGQWVSVLPKDMHLAPAKQRGFWVSAERLRGATGKDGPSRRR